MRCIALAAAVLTSAVTTACSSVSDVVRAGPGTYMVSAGGGMYTQNPSGIREGVYRAANAKCDQMGQTMKPVDVEERPYELGRHTASVELTFRCVR